MKSLIILFVVAVLTAPSVLAQSQNEGNKKAPTEKQETVQKQPQQKPGSGKVQAHKKLKGFIDTDGDGIDDRTQGVNNTQGVKQSKQMRQRMKDHFIDNDGDGINDNRCNGLGFGQNNNSMKHRGGKK